MKITTAILISICCLSSNAFAQVSPFIYMASGIPDSLIKNADAVVREDATYFRVKDIDHAVMEVHTIVTVFNEGGKDRL